jgi:hypothetical protein
MTAHFAIAATTLVLSACSTAQPVSPQPPADSPPPYGTTAGHKCDDSNIQQFVGQQRSDALEKQMLQVSNAATVRWVPPGTAVTMEYRFDRLTVFLDSNDRVQRISCS